MSAIEHVRFRQVLLYITPNISGVEIEIFGAAAQPLWRKDQNSQRRDAAAGMADIGGVYRCAASCAIGQYPKNSC